MALIQTVAHDQAEGDTKEAFDTLKGMIGVVPTPIKMASASPALLSIMWQSLKYFTQHPNLSFPLLSTIRFLVARKYDYVYCTDFNKNFLLQQGMSEDDIDQIIRDPEQAPLEDKDRAMLGFVMKAIQTPEAVALEDMDRLHAFGWTDTDILDALAHGTNMIGASIMMKAFKMDQAC